MYTRDSRELNEIKYLKKISGISSLTLKGTDFIELEEQNGVDNLYSFYTKKFKPNDLSLLKLSSKVSILEKITELFYKKIDSLKDSKSKEYYFLTKFSFGSLVKNNHIASQKIISRYNTVPLYIIPTLVKLSFDTKNILQDDSLIVWKDKIKKNQPIIEFIIADKPFIPQELFDYQISEESEHIGKGDFYLPLFDINETDKYQDLILKFFNDDKISRFPLDEKNDENIKPTDYLESLELIDVNETNLEQIFSLMALHLNHVVTEKKEILHNNNYQFNSSKIFFSLSEKDVDVLYKAYCLIDDSITKSSVDIKDKLAFDFFKPENKKILSSMEEENIFFNSDNHYGSFNINIVSDKDLISLALNQRIVLNTTNTKNFNDGDVLAVNGPPGTGKTTVLQSIVANMVSENIFDFIENKNSFIWDKNSYIKTPKLLNIGCSFTQQAVKNILNSLNFDPPKYNHQEIDLIWNKRWIYCGKNQNSLGYVLDSSQTNENKNKITFFLDNIGEIQDYFTEKHQALFFEQYNVEQNLKNELLNIKHTLNEFNLSSFKNVFFLNHETNQYEIKPKYYLSIEHIEEQENTNREKKNALLNQLNSLEYLINKNQEQLNNLKLKEIHYQNRLENLILSDWKKIDYPPIFDLIQNHTALLRDHQYHKTILTHLKNKSLEPIGNDVIKELIALQNNVSKEIKQLLSDLKIIDDTLKTEKEELDSEKNHLNNIKASFLSKIKIRFFGTDKNIKQSENKLKNINLVINNLNTKKEDNSSQLLEKQNLNQQYERSIDDQVEKIIQETSIFLINNQEEINRLSERINRELISEIETITENNRQNENDILNTENEYNLLISQKNKLLKEREECYSKEKIYETEKKQILEAKKETSLILNTITKQLKNNIFDEFYYAKESIHNLINKIESQGIDLLSLYNDLSVILDNTLRYKCFQLSMRLKEWYFIKLTKELSSLEDTRNYQSFNPKAKSFKNTLELYELNYFSLIFPLIISTLHSLGRKVSLYQNKKNVTLPGKVDNIIVDESGQISAEIGYIAAWNAKRLLCVGDTDQIKPVFSIEKKLDYFISKKDKRISKELTLEEYGTSQDNLGQVNCCEASLMNIAQKLTKYHQYRNLELSRGLYLIEHRRCPDEIIDYCNEIIYKGILIPKKGNFHSILKKETDVIKNNIQKPWEFIKVAGIVEANKNEAEALAIYNYIEKLINNSNGKYSWNNIGKDLAILSPFRNQANFILDFVRRKVIDKYQFKFGSNRLRINNNEDSDDDLIIGTVHALQGAEKKIILFSFVSNSLSSNSMVIKDKSILNVAISRSKLNIVLFGSEKVYENQSKELEVIRQYIDNKE